MGAAPDERLKGSTEIQGNILAGFNKPVQLFLFLNFKHNQKGARAWLRRLTGDQRIATTRDVAAHNREYRDLRKQFGARRLRQERRVRQEWMGVGLTSWGLVTLHPELAAELVAFDAYWRGPLSGGRDEQGTWLVPAAVVGDVQKSDPSAWVVGGPDQDPVDALVTIAADDEDRLRQRMNDELDLVKQYGLELLEVRQRDGSTTPGQFGQTLPPPNGGGGGVEHFGFRDGVSQPSVRGFTGAEFRNKRWESARKPGSPIIATGEFVLGYPGERGSYPRTPRPVTPSWMRDGSFQVFLRLTQDVAGWWDRMDRLGSEWSEDIAAKAIGRRRDGTPLAPAAAAMGSTTSTMPTTRRACTRRASPTSAWPMRAIRTSRTYPPAAPARHPVRPVRERQGRGREAGRRAGAVAQRLHGQHRRPVRVRAAQLDEQPAPSYGRARSRDRRQHTPLHPPPRG